MKQRYKIHVTELSYNFTRVRHEQRVYKALYVSFIVVPHPIALA